MTEIHALNVEKTATHMAASAAAESLAQLFADAERRKEAGGLFTAGCPTV